MTGYADGADIAGHGIEPKDILRKPFTEDDLARAVNTQLGDAP